MRIAFSVFGRPKGKERPRVDRRSGRIYTPTSTADTEKAIAQEFALRAPRHKPWTGPVKLTVIAVFAIPTSWPKALREAATAAKVWHVARGQLDLDNAVKLVSDALNGKAWVDDAQVAVITAGKRYGAPERLDVVIETLDQPDVPQTPGQRRLEAMTPEERLTPKKRRGGSLNKSKSKLPLGKLGAAVAAALARGASPRGRK